MTCFNVKKGPILSHQRNPLEVEMVGQERWAEIRRLHFEAGESISAIARLLDPCADKIRRKLSQLIECVAGRVRHKDQQANSDANLLVGWNHLGELPCVASAYSANRSCSSL